MFAHWAAMDSRDGGLDRRSSSRGARPRSGLNRGRGAAAAPASSQCVQQAEGAARAAVKTTVAASGDQGRFIPSPPPFFSSQATTDDKMRCPIFSLQEGTRALLTGDGDLARRSLVLWPASARPAGCSGARTSASARPADCCPHRRTPPGSSVPSRPC